MKLKESIQGVLSFLLLSGIVLLGIVFINARMGKQNAVAETTANTNVNLNS